ncbi:hypothetical protein CERSUDRAFT_92144 [Gelatoporia subvermispora B]|uniref:Uncharacterized protein n=1 Tax=Ceriporiopsis subvermispora (strain B) TaxID=914234 RepID=M2R501_CERS8|nr:hypothetical protein CERSUDRAFT_92144 [Gelatoporia subvermispora B]
MLLGLNILSIVGYATDVFLTSEFFTTPYVHLQILATGPHPDTSQALVDCHNALSAKSSPSRSQPQQPGQPRRPAFVRSQYDEQARQQSTGLVFASFVDNMGEELIHHSNTSDDDSKSTWISDDVSNNALGPRKHDDPEAVIGR